MTAYWIEMVLDASEIDESANDLAFRLAEELDKEHDDVTYTVAGGVVSLAVSCVSDEPIENLPSKVVGHVRSIVHGFDYGTPDWPEPVGVSDVRVFELSDEPAAAC